MLPEETVDEDDEDDEDVVDDKESEEGKKGDDAGDDGKVCIFTATFNNSLVNLNPLNLLHSPPAH